MHSIAEFADRPQQVTATIDELLRLRGAHRLSGGGNPRLAQSRLQHSKFIGEHYVLYDLLRPHLLHHHDFPYVDENGPAAAVIRYLMRLGWIARMRKNAYRITDDNGIRNYLAGGWLEELAFMAHRAAGVDEAYYGQQIAWRVDGVAGQNEIDVIARRGDLLSFTSCKTLRAHKNDGQMALLRNFLTEADYWNIHFADDKGRALLIVTTDMVDEMHHNRQRYPELLARATILNVSIAGLEQLHWDRLIDVIEKHWR